MKNYDDWKKFVRTGKIDDYLRYIACTQEKDMDEFLSCIDISGQNADISIENSNITIQSLGRDKEGGYVAGINYRNWDGSVGHAN